MKFSNYSVNAKGQITSLGSANFVAIGMGIPDSYHKEIFDQILSKGSAPEYYDEIAKEFHQIFGFWFKKINKR